MYTKKSTPQAYSSGLVNDSFASVLHQYFPLQIAPTASRCDRQIVLNLLLDATLHNRTVTASLNILNQPESGLPNSDSVFHHLKKLEIAEVQQWYDLTNQWTIHQLRSRGALRTPRLVAIDEHRRPYYGKEDCLTTRGQHKNGTNKAHAVISAEVIEDGPRPTLATTVIPPLVPRHEYTKKLLDKTEKSHVAIKGYLIDRGFFGVDNLKVLDHRDVPYLMGCPASKRVRQIWQQNRRDAVCIRNTFDEFEEVLVIHDYIVGTKKSSVSTTLIIVQKITGEETFINSWVTNFPCTPSTVDALLGTYRSRWGIETGYRSKKEARAKTVAKNPALRLALILLSFLLYNLWRLAQWASRQRDMVGTTVPLYYYVFRHSTHHRLCRRILNAMMAR